MSARFRQKACHACADSKRKCDKQLPECQRCIDRDIDCHYPEPPRRRRRQPPNNGLSLGNADPRQGDYGNHPIGFATWESSAEVDFNAILTDIAVQPLGDMPLPFSDVPAPHNVEDALLYRNGRDDPLKEAPTWFLQDDTWHLSHPNENPSPSSISLVDLEPLIGAVEQQLRSWVENGYNGFIHHRLYDGGMPTALQDAYTTAASYLVGTPAAKRTTLQIAEERCARLIQRGGTSPENTAKFISDQMAHVHALFVYIYIRLIDGSVRMRSSAEKQISVVRAQLVALREATRQYQGNDILSRHSALTWSNIEPETEYRACQEMWRLWILTESVRRSHLLIETTLNTYQALSRGWAECTGVMMMTVRNGLWGAESSVKWFRQCCDKSPLLVPSLNPEAVISSHDAKEIDDFAKMMWTYIVGGDRMQCWVDSS